MKKITQRLTVKPLLLIIISLFLIFPATVGAQDGIEKKNTLQKYIEGLQPAVDQAYGGGEEIKLEGDPFVLYIVAIINNLLTFLAVIFFMLFMYAGWLWMTARGNEEQVAKSKKMLQEIIIGLLIILLARITIEFILNQAGTAFRQTD